MVMNPFLKAKAKTAINAAIAAAAFTTVWVENWLVSDVNVGLGDWVGVTDGFVDELGA